MGRTTSVVGENILYDPSTNCPESAEALSEMLETYKPRDYGTITCSPNGAFRVGGVCGLVAQTLNSLVNSYLDGVVLVIYDHNFVEGCYQILLISLLSSPQKSVIHNNLLLTGRFHSYRCRYI